MQADAGEWDGQSRVTAEAWPSEHSGHFLDTTGASSLCQTAERAREMLYPPPTGCFAGWTLRVPGRAISHSGKVCAGKRQSEVKSQDFSQWVFKSCF